MSQSKRKQAQLMSYIEGDSSKFYFACRNGEIDHVRAMLNDPSSPSIDDLNERQPNGSTALHAATYNGHTDIVKLLLDRDCCRTTLNRYGKTAYEEASTPEMQQLVARASQMNRFYETNTVHTTALYVIDESKQMVNPNETLDFVRIFQSQDEILDYALNQQTTALWIKFYNWFCHTFRLFIERDNFHIDSFDLHKHPDFQHFLKRSLPEPEKYRNMMKAINEAKRCNSIEPLITVYTSETAGFYGPLNRQLADSPDDPQMSPHLCDRFIIEFLIHRHELKQRTFTGMTYRGAKISKAELSNYKGVLNSQSGGILGLKTFTSTSIDRCVALEFIAKSSINDHECNVLFVFDIDRISSTIFAIEDISVFGQEREVLILPGTLFVVTRVEEQIGFKLIEIHLRYWHTSISFFQKLKQTARSGAKTVI
ncbi:unnamed protein product [Rotaria sp. Silwood2]|nr:unnamed protein product [Rotaria sp. Silwood2]